jgi:hypothetical protein
MAHRARQPPDLVAQVEADQEADRSSDQDADEEVT